MSINIKINGETYEANEGEWLIDTLNRHGFDVPHFCYHPGLGPDGNCRMCQVEIVSDRGARLSISCNLKVNDGMDVVTNSDRVKAARAGVEEFLLLNHPLDCPICDKAGECTLQNYYMEHDMGDSRQDFVRFKKEKALDIGPTMILDQERCVLCDRCVRFLRDWAGSEELYIAGRGHEAFLTTFPGKEVTSPYSLNTVDLCPVGALTSKDFRFSIPTWFLKRTPSTCTSCSRGCSIEVDSKAKEVKRLRPRFNPHVNGHWMCDEGRLNYKFVNTDRITEHRVDRNGEKFESSYDEALADLQTILNGPKDDSDSNSTDATVPPLVVLASATCTLEEMYLLKKIAAARNGTVCVVRHIPDGEQDALLRRSDKHPNTKGAEILGLKIVNLGASEDTEDQLDLPADGVLLAVGFDVAVGDALEQMCAKFSKKIIIASRETAMTKTADVLFPGWTFAEKEGLLVNFEGHIQQLSPALDGVWERLATWEVLRDVLSSLTGESSFDTIVALRTTLASDEPAFNGLDLNGVGQTGISVQPQSV